MMITKKQLDKRICDVEDSAKNTQTYREFIKESEVYFDMPHHDLDSMTVTQLNEHLSLLEYLWTK